MVKYDDFIESIQNCSAGNCEFCKINSDCKGVLWNMDECEITINCMPYEKYKEMKENFPFKDLFISIHDGQPMSMGELIGKKRKISDLIKRWWKK